MDMIILSSNTEKISFISGSTKEISRADVENFSFKEDSSMEQLLTQEYELAKEEYASVISEADKIFLEKKAIIDRDYNETVRHSMEVFSGELSDADNKKSIALENLCLEKERLLKTSSEKLKLAKDRLVSYQEDVKKLREIEVLRETFVEEDGKALAKVSMPSQQTNIGASATYSPIKASGSGKLKF